MSLKDWIWGGFKWEQNSAWLYKVKEIAFSELQIKEFVYEMVIQNIVLNATGQMQTQLEWGGKLYGCGIVAYWRQGAHMEAMKHC